MDTISSYQALITSTKEDIAKVSAYVGDSHYDQTKVTNYLAEGNEYLSSLEQSLQRRTSQIVQVVNIDIPNAKDKNEWYAGGTLRNESFSGGVNFSPTDIPSYDNKQQTFSMSRSLLNGNFLFLNGGFALVDSLVKGGMLDLLQRINDTNILRLEYTTTITNTITGQSVSTNGFFNISDGGDNAIDNIGIETNTHPASLEETKAAFDTQFSMFHMNPLSITFTMIETITQQEVTISKTLSSALMGTVFGTMKGVLSQSVVSALSITNVAMSLAVGFVVGLAFDEAMEVAMGLDTTFGFGGDIQGTNSMGNGMFSSDISMSKGISDVLSEVFSFGMANTDTFNPSSTGLSLTDAMGNNIGFSSMSGSFTGMNGVGGFTDSFGNSISGISDAVNSNSFGQLSDSTGGFQSGLGNSQGLGFNNDTNGLGAGLEGVNTGGLSSIGDANNGADTGGDGSFIATAMDKALGTDTVKIYEDYRDNYVLHTKGGKTLMQKYYILSPRIVKEIDLLSNNKEIYQWIYDEYLSVGVELIKAKEYELAFDGYSQLVRTLYAMFVKKDKKYKNQKLLNIVTKKQTHLNKIG
ncbi:MAG: hypothetical protein KAQ94_06015 [Arcobacteraceae bacterium]|nr:hypothetical protein [Arcobacteraceae bacterium]